MPARNACFTYQIREIVSFASPDQAGNEEKIRQALKIACADEFVNDVDTELGESGSELTDRTVIIVTHRKAALSICDRVLKFDGTLDLRPGSKF